MHNLLVEMKDVVEVDVMWAFMNPDQETQLTNEQIYAHVLMISNDEDSEIKQFLGIDTDVTFEQALERRFKGENISMSAVENYIIDFQNLVYDRLYL